MIKLKNAVIFCKNIFRKSKLPYLTKWGNPRIDETFIDMRKSMNDEVIRALGISDIISFISDDRIRKLTDDCYNAELGRYE